MKLSEDRAGKSKDMKGGFSRVICVGAADQGAVGQELVGSVGVVELIVLDLVALAARGVVNVRVEGPVMGHTEHMHQLRTCPSCMHQTDTPTCSLKLPKPLYACLYLILWP